MSIYIYIYIYISLLFSLLEIRKFQLVSHFYSRFLHFVTQEDWSSFPEDMRPSHCRVVQGLCLSNGPRGLS